MLTIEEGIEPPSRTDKNMSREIRETLDAIPIGKPTPFRIHRNYRGYVMRYAKEKGYKVVTAVAKDGIDEVRVWRIA